MKMYKKMGFDTEAALKWVGECVMRGCADCPARKTQMLGDHGTECASRYLLSEVPEPPKVPRWMTAKTQEDFDRLFDDFKKLCKETVCEDCKYYEIWRPLKHNVVNCYHTHLSEFIDAPESEAENG